MAGAEITRMDPSPPEPAMPANPRRRRLRAVFAADIANFGGLVSVDETRTMDALWVARRIALEELEAQGGWLFGLPGDGIFALFESAVAAVRCGLNIQTRLVAAPKLNALRMRIGIHLGEVLFQDELPFGESLVTAARLESLADPGGILVSASVLEAVGSRVSATFSERGVQNLKHSPRRIATYAVTPAPERPSLDGTVGQGEPLDRTVMARSMARANVPALPGALPGPPPPLALPYAEPSAGPSVSPRLPKATPLVIPHHLQDTIPPPAPPPPAEPEPVVPVSAPSAPPSPDPAFNEVLGELAKILTAHVGPLAGLLVRQHAAAIAEPTMLIRALAEEIPTEAERLEFASRAHELIERRR
jgi:class 3 adenylate cyclase